jgi:hypothetical protein
MGASYISATTPSTGSTLRAIAIFKGNLQQHRQRAPKGSEKALTKAYTLEEITTKQIFLNHEEKDA